jgi:hypothetical protein
MAQTTGQLSMACGKIEVSTDGVTWNDISGSAQSITGVTQTRMSGEAYTQDGDIAVITAGKREPMTPTVTIIYTETNDEAWRRAYNEFTADCGDSLRHRWSPGGGDVGDWRYYTPATEIISFDFPAIDAADGSPIKCSYQFKTPQITRETISS